jgi:RNA polymerase sigma-70 factor (ECF subfamily)
MEQRLAAAFLSRFKSRVHPYGSQPSLGRDLRDLFGAGRERWPDLALDAFAFVEHLAARLAAGASPPPPLSRVHGADLYLALACLLETEGPLGADPAGTDSDPNRGKPLGRPGGRQGPAAASAVALFERELLPTIVKAVSRVDASESFRREMEQRVRIHLFIADEHGLPKIASYSGTGSLAAWTRIVALRLSLSHKRDAGELPADPDLIEALPEIDASPELTLLKASYGPRLERAVGQALAGLQSEQRNLLRLYYLEGLKIGEIGAMIGVHPSTVWRRIVRCRREVFEQTRARLREELDIGDDELSSLVAKLYSQLDVSIERLLGGETG